MRLVPRSLRWVVARMALRCQVSIPSGGDKDLTQLDVTLSLSKGDPHCAAESGFDRFSLTYVNHVIPGGPDRQKSSEPVVVARIWEIG